MPVAVEAIQAYPLSWPLGWPRTPESRRQHGQFQVGFTRARDELLEELRRLGAKRPVISTDIPTRKDGLPYAGRSWRIGDDPGVAIYFALRDEPKAMACDAYRKPEANLRALGLSIAALRALDRYGVAGMLDRAFQGFSALPSPDHFDWRATLGFGPHDAVTEMAVELKWRELARANHPDRGGTDAAMARINRARDEALKEILRPA